LSIEQIPALVERGRLRAAAFFERLDGQLQTNEFVAGARFSLADITAFVAVEFARWSKIEIADDQQGLKRWYAAVAARPSMQA
jgi:glutathione S-transferase